MIALDLGIGILTGDARFSHHAVAAILRDVPKLFRDASGQDIYLTMHLSPAGFGPDTGEPLSSVHLHRALEAVTGRQRRRRKVSNIGLLFADEYDDRRDYFGVMFDEAFASDHYDPWSTTPREGCAGFVRAIDAAGGSADELTAPRRSGHAGELRPFGCHRRARTRPGRSHARYAPNGRVAMTPLGK